MIDRTYPFMNTVILGISRASRSTVKGSCSISKLEVSKEVYPFNDGRELLSMTVKRRAHEQDDITDALQ